MTQATLTRQPLGFQILSTRESHLEITCRGTNGRAQWLQKFYFPQGYWKDIKDFVKQQEQKASAHQGVNVFYTLVNHQSIPVWDGNLPELATDEQYQVELLRLIDSDTWGRQWVKETMFVSKSVDLNFFADDDEWEKTEYKQEKSQLWENAVILNVIASSQLEDWAF